MSEFSFKILGKNEFNKRLYVLNRKSLIIIVLIITGIIITYYDLSKPFSCYGLKNMEILLYRRPNFICYINIWMLHNVCLIIHSNMDLQVIKLEVWKRLARKASKITRLATHKLQGQCNSCRIRSCIFHYSDVIISVMASQITGVSIVCSGAEKHQSYVPLAPVRGIDRWSVNSPYKGPVTRKCFHLMTSSCGSKIHEMKSDVFGVKRSEPYKFPKNEMSWPRSTPSVRKRSGCTVNRLTPLLPF